MVKGKEAEREPKDEQGSSPDQWFKNAATTENLTQNLEAESVWKEFKESMANNVWVWQGLWSFWLVKVFLVIGVISGILKIVVSRNEH